MKFQYIIPALFSLAMLSSSAYADEKERPVHAGAMVGLGLPSAFSVQGLVKYKNLIGGNLELGMTPTLSISDSTLHQEMFDVSARVYPFRGDFFLGLGIGRQRLTAETLQSAAGVSEDAKMTVNTTFLSPRLGFIHRWSFGFAIGMDLAVEIPLAGDVSTFSSNGNLPSNITKLGDRVKTTPIPVLHLLQLGYIF